MCIFCARLNPRFRLAPEAEIKTPPELERAARWERNFDAVRSLVLALPELPASTPTSGGVARSQLAAPIP